MQGIVFNPMPIDCDVKGMQTLKLEIPIQITSDFKPSKTLINGKAVNYDFRKVFLSFCGPKGNNFGQEIAFEIKVILEPQISVVNREDLFRAALNMSENMNLGSFDECVEALKKANGD